MRALRIVVVLVVLLGGGGLVADRWVHHRAEGEAARRVEEREGVENADVGMRGFPFLTQLASGRMDRVDVRMDGYRARTERGRVRVARVDAALRGVRFDDDYERARAEKASGTARITYQDLLTSLGREEIPVATGVSAKVASLKDGGKGRLAVGVRGTVFGHALPGTFTVLCSVSLKGGDRFVIHADALPDLGIPLPGGSGQALDIEQRAGDLPEGLRLDSVRVGEDGIRVGFSGKDLDLREDEDTR
ncbi:LmeA family phospholipid-binding protein [Streptomyces sp. P6-2-1]|uniref:LmeA family phospholipid-binding protein n=1 Tax=unclassified Streptomyces TaxID=2593676 RepID=UPI003D35BDD2